MQTIHLVPAFGRDYKSQRAIFDAWMMDCVFKTVTGRYVNRSQVKDLIADGNGRVNHESEPSVHSRLQGLIVRFSISGS